MSSGLVVNALTNTLYVGRGDRCDTNITKIVELTRSGELTGVEIPISSDSDSYLEHAGFSLNSEGDGFVVVSVENSVPDLVNYRAFDPVVPPQDLQYTRHDSSVNLTWTNGEDYDGIEVYRNQAVKERRPVKCSTGSSVSGVRCAVLAWSWTSPRCSSFEGTRTTTRSGS